MYKKSSVAKANEAEARKCGTRWAYVVPWHADVDEQPDPVEVLDCFAATYSEIVAGPNEGFAPACPCSASSSACDNCQNVDDRADNEIFLLKELVSEVKALGFHPRNTESSSAGPREARLEARLTAPMARGRRGILAGQKLRF